MASTRRLTAAIGIVAGITMTAAEPCTSAA
jgi:hypothetical protein